MKGAGVQCHAQRHKIFFSCGLHTGAHACARICVPTQSPRHACIHACTASVLVMNTCMHTCMHACLGARSYIWTDLRRKETGPRSVEALEPACVAQLQRSLVLLVCVFVSSSVSVSASVFYLRPSLCMQTCICCSSDKESPTVVVLKPLLHGAKPVVSFSLHGSPVRLLAHLGGTDICFSADRDGGLELWGVHTGRRVSKDSHPEQIAFEFKAETHLFDLQKVSSLLRLFVCFVFCPLGEVFLSRLLSPFVSPLPHTVGLPVPVETPI